MRRFIAISLLIHAALLVAWRVNDPATHAADKRLAINLIASPTEPALASAATCCKTDHAVTHPAAKNHAARQSAIARKADARPSRLTRRTEQVAIRVTADDNRDAPKKTASVLARSPNLAATAEVTRDTSSARDEPAQTTGDAASLGLRLRSRLLLALHEHLAYPAIARRYGWQGIVEMRLRVEADGRVSHIELVRSSGYAALDQAALTSTRRIDTVAEAASWLHGNYVDLLLPVEYRLIEG